MIVGPVMSLASPVTALAFFHFPGALFFPVVLIVIVEFASAHDAACYVMRREWKVQRLLIPKPGSRVKPPVLVLSP